MITEETYSRYANDPSAFRDDLYIDVDGWAERFEEVMDPFQREDFASLDPALLKSMGRYKSDEEGVSNRAYFERGRGHSKTADLAVTVVWSLVFSNRPLKGYCFAADKDQADLLRAAIETLVRLNPWLSEILVVLKDSVTVARGIEHPGEGGELRIFTSDVGSSYGILPDLIICDELVHWAGDGSLWDSILSSAAKRKNCLLVIISNAGFVDSWQWRVRESARTNEGWIFHSLDGPVASWLTEDRLEEQRKMLPPIAYSRLWENRWSTGGGDALTPEDINAAFIDTLKPMRGRTKGWLFVAGVDLGLKRDASAVVVLAVPYGGKAGRIRLADTRIWKPEPGTKVDLLDVERHLLDLDTRYGLEAIAFDPWQAESMAQRIEADSGRYRRNQKRRFHSEAFMKEITPQTTNLRKIASLTIESFNDRRLQLYEEENLRRDLLKLRVEEKSYGMRLTSPRDGNGHGDTFSAFSLALLVGHDFAGRKPNRVEASLSTGFDRTERGGYRGAIERFKKEQRLYDVEQEVMADMEDEPNPLREVMQHFGRTA